VTWAHYFGEIERRSRLMDAAGVPRCEWMATPRDLDEAQAHQAACPVCKTRRDYANAHFGPRPPFPRWWRSGNGSFSIVALPPWVIPAVFGAVGVGGITAVRVITALFGPTRPSFGIGLVTIGLAILAGSAAGGLLYKMAAAVFPRRSALGEYLTGILLWAGYIGVFLLTFALSPGRIPIQKPSDAMALAGLTVVIGLAGARVWRSIFPIPS